VELASLGLAAYVGLITAVAATLFRLARQARAGRSPLWQSYVVAGLTGTMVGRLVEQIAGKAQIADLLLSWALAAVVVSMAAMASQRDNAPAESSPQPARTNARASSQRGRRGEGKAEAKHPLRLAGAALLTVGLTVIWWQSVVSPVAASVTGAKAAQAGFASQYAETVERYQQAISQDSGVAANHLALAEATKTLATFESSVERRMALLSVADAHLEQVLARNPLDHRARRIQIDVKTEMVRIDPSLLPDAVSAVATLEALQPIYWGPMVQYANLLFVVGDREAAQKAVDRAKRLGLGQPQFEAMYADLNEKFGPGL
jgi:tetratricopeptide (TPR) repeat protein